MSTHTSGYKGVITGANMSRVYFGLYFNSYLTFVFVF